MKWFSDLKLSKKMGIIILFFLVGMVVFGLMSYQTIEKLRVNGDMYLQIVQGKYLIADILPPPDYIVESYLNAYQMIDETNKEKLNQLIDKAKSLKEDYINRHNYWAKALPDNEMKDDMINKSYNPAMKFYDLRDSKFIPLILNGKRDEARTLLSTVMKEEYEQHRSYIDKVVDMASKNNSLIEDDAKDIIQSRTISLLIVGIVIILLLFFVVSRIFKNILVPINKVLEMAKEIQKGHIKARANVNINDEIGIMAQITR